ncbi:MAG: hypothetical protein QG640_575 [Patescibacteria group bacterium]|nr:hypothetical protein [Patescibacteria group bacterium]
MTIEVGVGLAFVAMLCWGFGDFLIQRSARKLGDWETLFVITAFGAVVLLPFVYRNIGGLFASSNNELLILISAAVVLIIAALFTFEGFKKGKISVLEPLMSFEIPAAALLAFFFLGDDITWMQILVIIVLIINLFLVSFRGKFLSKSFLLEKGVIIFFVGALLMGSADFLLGWGSRVTDPLMANFVLNIIMASVSFIFIVLRGGIKKLISDVRTNPAQVLAMSIADNVAWIAYAYAMVLVPIAIATGLSESSIIIAVLLGLFINKEKLQRHQKVGLIGAIVSAIVLAFITSA